MKVDFHFHLEEGPYSFKWLQRTASAIANLAGSEERKHSLSWMTTQIERLQKRLSEGSFSEHWIETYMTAGQLRGIERFGIVDHLYRFDEFRNYYERYMTLDNSDLGRLQHNWLEQVRIGSIDEYLSVVQKTQKKGYPISLGVEADFFPGGEVELKKLLDQYELDYVIGSVHFIDGWGFDNPELQHLFEKRNLLDLYAQGFEHVKQAARSGIFDIIAHLDNLKVFNYRPKEADMLELYDDVAKTLKEADVASEINTGLAYRYPVKEMCPNPTFLNRLYAHGVPITLGSDSHFPDDIGTMLEEAEQLARDTGYTEIVYFENRKRIHTAL
ncbi:histidinol-phosphatase (PHP family) [Paenibacillus endophyticus]|uniref:Histidinol-phosphatase n=1 Tax=Paenibacillus endophyticus TaxID=1294268 RepID=A0A7W5CDX6_9BACL|nr:histidinol-phosphatase HisJ family protein [Paenibacillus endophyticus]MBB3155900.1 histidinol-phosphatase (PHP family) [Paenibacillus endophyticus]